MFLLIYFCSCSIHNDFSNFVKERFMWECKSPILWSVLLCVVLIEKLVLCYTSTSTIEIYEQLLPRQNRSQAARVFLFFHDASWRSQTPSNVTYAISSYHFLLRRELRLISGEVRMHHIIIHSHDNQVNGTSCLLI